MAEELSNARIDQLPLCAELKPGYWGAVRNMDNHITERFDFAALLTSTTTGNFEWITDHPYSDGEVVTWQGEWYQANGDIAENVVPGTDPAWEVISKSPSGFTFWQAGVYTQDDVFVLYKMSTDPEAPDIQIFWLANPLRPFPSVDFLTELDAGDWIMISGGGDGEGGGGSGIIERAWKFVANTTAGDPGNGFFRMNNADVTLVTELYFAEVAAASFDAAALFGVLEVGNRIVAQQRNDSTRIIVFEIASLPVDNGSWWTIGVNVIDSGGLLFVASAECTFLFDLSKAPPAIPDASESVKGIIEIATQAEVNAGTDDLRAITPLKLSVWPGNDKMWSLATGGTLTGVNTIIGTTTNILKVVFNSLGNTQTDGAGLWLQNITPASSGNQQISPAITWEGQGWKTTATAASQTIKFTTYVLPVQGTGTVLGTLKTRVSINGGNYTGAGWSYLHDGSVALGASNGENAKIFPTVSFTGATVDSAAAGTFFGFTNVIITQQPVIVLGLSASNNFASTTGAPALVVINGGFSPPSGSASFKVLRTTNIINQMGGANGTVTAVSPEFTITAATDVIGYEWNPINPSNISGVHYAFRSSSGRHGFGTLTPSAKAHIKGDGTTTGQLFKLDDSANTNRFLVLDNGTVMMPTLTNQESYSRTVVIHTDGTLGYSLINNTGAVVSLTISGTANIDLSTGKTFLLTQSGNVTSFDFTNAVVGVTYTFIITRTTNATFTFATGKYRLPLGIAPTLTDPTTNGIGTAIDILIGICNVAGRLDVVLTPDLQNN